MWTVWGRYWGQYGTGLRSTPWRPPGGGPVQGSGHVRGTTRERALRSPGGPAGAYAVEDLGGTEGMYVGSCCGCTRSCSRPGRGRSVVETVGRTAGSPRGAHNGCSRAYARAPRESAGGTSVGNLWQVSVVMRGPARRCFCGGVLEVDPWRTQRKKRR